MELIRKVIAVLALSFLSSCGALTAIPITPPPGIGCATDPEGRK